MSKSIQQQYLLVKASCTQLRRVTLNKHPVATAVPRRALSDGWVRILYNARQQKVGYFLTLIIDKLSAEYMF